MRLRRRKTQRIEAPVLEQSEAVITPSMHVCKTCRHACLIQSTDLVVCKLGLGIMDSSDRCEDWSELQ